MQSTLQKHIDDSWLLPTMVEFVRNRHGIFTHKRSHPEDPDPARHVQMSTQHYDIFSNNKFTNAYRILDRQSQYLLHNAVLPYIDDPTDIRIAAIYLCRLFNQPQTFEYIRDNIGIPCTPEAVHTACNSLQTYHIAKREHKLFSNAYLLNPPKNYKGIGHGWVDKYFESLAVLLNNDYRVQLLNGGSLSAKFELMRSLEGFAEFLSYQFALDFAYADSNLPSCEYDEFVVVGLGAHRGMEKVFPELPKKHRADMCTHLAKSDYFGLLCDGRRLRGNDIQNCFCEYDKFSRATHPHLNVGGTKRIKSRYVKNPMPMAPIVWANNL